MKTKRNQQRLRDFGTLAAFMALTLALILFPVSRLGAEGTETGGGTETSEGYEFHGVVQGLPTGPSQIGDWTISGKIIHVSAATLFAKEPGDPAIATGSAVDVKGVLQADGSIVASAIDSDIGGNSDVQQEGEN
jgi:hypothetical protein